MTWSRASTPRSREIRAPRKKRYNPNQLRMSLVKTIGATEPMINQTRHLEWTLNTVTASFGSNLVSQSIRWWVKYVLIMCALALAPAAACADEQQIITATKSGDLTTVELLLGSGADPNVRDAQNNTALIFACRDGHTDIAATLIDHGASIDWQDDEGVTPLIIAAFKGHIDVVRHLLDHGARRDILDKWHRSALTYALRRGPDDAITQLLRRAD